MRTCCSTNNLHGREVVVPLGRKPKCKSVLKKTEHISTVRSEEILKGTGVKLGESRRAGGRGKIPRGQTPSHLARKKLEPMSNDPRLSQGYKRARIRDKNNPGTEVKVGGAEEYVP